MEVRFCFYRRAVILPGNGPVIQRKAGLVLSQGNGSAGSGLGLGRKSGFVFIAGRWCCRKRPGLSAGGGAGSFIAGWRLCRKQAGLSVEGGVGFLARQVVVLAGIGSVCQRKGGRFFGHKTRRFYRKQPGYSTEGEACFYRKATVLGEAASVLGVSRVLFFPPGGGVGGNGPVFQSTEGSLFLLQGNRFSSSGLVFRCKVDLYF
jgi:hypothetical protein